MKTKQKTVYYCEYCKKHGLMRWRIEYHEKYCYGNPENLHKCWDCKHLDIDAQYFHESDTVKSTNYFCLKQQKALYPAKYFEKSLKFRGLFEKTMMPKECDLFEKKVYPEPNVNIGKCMDLDVNLDEVDFENPF